MDLRQALQRAWQIVQLDRDAIRDVAADQNAMLPGIVLLALSGAIAAILSLNPIGLLLGPVLVVIGAFIGNALLHVLALLFGGKGSFGALFNVSAHGHAILSAANVIPVLGSLVALVWGVVVGVVTLEEVHGLSRGRAVVVMLIPVLLGLACVAVLFSLLVAAVLHAFHSP